MIGAILEKTKTKVYSKLGVLSALVDRFADGRTLEVLLIGRWGSGVKRGDSSCRLHVDLHSNVQRSKATAKATDC